ncbi:MAG: subfamily B ATP-binding cassette protein MsbA [Verrucomicrobiales bacterium]|jgi:subfamily B ATP-binding cassette protein MsbA
MAKKTTESTQKKEQKRLSKKDVAKMSNREFIAHAKVPYKRLLSYVKPYKSRFALGIIFGVLAGVSNAFILFGLKFVFAIVLEDPGKKGANQAAQDIAEMSKTVAVLSERAGQPDPAKFEKLGSDASEIAEATEKAQGLAAIALQLQQSVEKIAANAEGRDEVLENDAWLAATRIEALARAAAATTSAKDASDELKPFKGIPGMKNVQFEPPELPPGYEWIWVAGVCAIVPIMILGRGLLGYLHHYCMLWVGMKVLKTIRDQVFSNLLRQSLKFYGKAKTGELMQTVFNQTRMAQMAGTQLASDLIKNPVSLLSIVAVLLLLDPLYTFAALVVFPFCILPVLMIAKKVRKAGGREEEEASTLMVTMQETFSGIKVVKSHAREEYERERFNAADRKMLANIMRWRKAMEIVGPLVETVASVGIAGGLVYAKMTNMSATEFILLNMALMSMYPHAKALSRVQIQLQKCLIATTKVFAFMDAKPDIEDAEDAVELKDVKGRIEFRDATFTYPNADAPAVHNLRARMKPGRTYALVGRSGAGKSTVLSLLMRFYDPQNGNITFDGIDIRKIKQVSLRDNIGIVNQDVFLFHDTILANIRYGRADATEEEVIAAAKKAHAHEFIIEKEGGYKAVVGDKGCTLSGGQQQRISIARAILRDAPILLLDEAYSALDSESEKLIHEAMEELSKGKTVIAIAHRLSTILNADQIIVMEGGKVLESGTHQELMETSEHYQKVYNLQFHGHASNEL